MTAAVSADGSTITVLFNTTQNLASFGPNIPASENLKKCQVVVQLAYDDRTYYNKVVASKLEGRTVLEYGVIATIDQSVVYDNNIQLVGGLWHEDLFR